MGNILKGQGSSKFLSSCLLLFFNAGENKTGQWRFKVILSVKEFCTDGFGCICLRNILNRMWILWILEEAWDRQNIFNESTQLFSCSQSTFIMLIKFHAVSSRRMWKLSFQINEYRLFTAFQETGYRSLMIVLVQM